MPTYEYRCRECGHAFEEFQAMKDEALIACPSCGRPGLKRLLGGGGGMIFKGTGFYGTDYKSSKQKSESSEEKKTETKKEAAKETPTATEPTAPPTTTDPKK